VELYFPWAGSRLIPCACRRDERLGLVTRQSWQRSRRCRGR